MCSWGTYRTVRVPIPADLSHTGAARWDEKPIDACIADLVEALNAVGVFTRSCCCGHGSGLGEITLQDGRVLMVASQNAAGSGDLTDRLKGLAYEAVAAGRLDLGTAIALLASMAVDRQELAAIQALRDTAAKRS